MEDQKNPAVYFYFGGGTKQYLRENLYILIFVKTSSWDDFGYETHSEYAVYDNDRQLTSGSLYLAFLEQKGDSIKGQSDLDKELASSQGFVSGEKLPIAITMHMSMQAYRKIIGDLGVDISNRVLFAINDMAYLRVEQPKSTSFSLGVKSSVFNQSFLRKSDSFFAYQNAESILRGLEYESFDSTSEVAHVKFGLAGFYNKHNLVFNFKGNEIFSNRVCVLIGKNGTGKSRALYNIAYAAVAGDHESLTNEFGERLKVNRIIAVSTPGETENTYPRNRKKSITPYVKISLRRRGRSDQSGGMGEAVNHLARSDESIKGEDRWSLFKSVAKEIAPLNEIALKTIELDAMRRNIGPYLTIDQISMSEGEHRWLELLGAIDRYSGFYHFLNGQAYPFSSGQITFLRFACQLCLHVENGALILLDEPETHLHPNLVVSFYSLLDRLLEASGSLAIIATHSAYFVREVPSSQVVFLREEEPGFIVSGPPRLRTLAADISAISFFIFGDDNKSIVAGKIKQRILSQNLSPGSIKEIMGNDLSSEMISYLSSEMQIDSEDLI
jgi:energy-coupling factor transporter ATP-binding protein EcfA2